MLPLKEMINQFVSEGFLVSDDSCDFASPLEIVNKKDGGIRMAVGYREVNLQLESTSNQFPYQPSLFQRLGGFFLENLTIYEVITNSVFQKRAQKSLLLLLHGGISFLACPFGISTAPGEYQERMAHEVLQDYYLNGAIV